MNIIQWVPQRLDELGFVGRGKSRHRPRNDPRLYGGPYPFIQTADIMSADPYITSNSQTYSECGLQQSKLWPPNTLCMTIAGANTAKTAILRIEACFPDSIVGFIPDKSKANLHFVKYSLDLMKERFRAVTLGATQDNLSIDKLLSFPLPTPPLYIQRKIAAILSAYDDLIENNLRRIKILEDMAQSLYREWFVKYRFPGHEKVRMVDSPMGKIPEGWKPAKLKNIVESIRNSTEAGEHLSNRRYVPIDCIGKQTLTLTESNPWTEAQSSLILFDKWDILFGAMRPYFHKVAVAPFDGVTRTTCFVFRPQEPQLFGYVAYLLFQPETISYATAHSKGATIPYATWENSMAELDVLQPTKAEVIAFNHFVKSAIELCLNLAAKNVCLRATRDLLLPKLISGQVDVSGLGIVVPEEAEA